MLKKTVTYIDYNDVERTEDFYFNLSKAELLDMELTTVGGFADYIQKIINAKDQAQLIKLFKRIVLEAFGEKSEDGRRFIKSKELSEAFSQTEAYVIIYMECVSDDKKAAEFINGILPKDMREEVEKQQKAETKSK